MRRLFGWLAGLVGIAALARHLARRERVNHAPAPPPAVRDPAEELRRKLSQTRVDVPAQKAPEAPAEPAEPEAPRDSLEDRRARVHAKAREAMDEMREP